MSGNNYEASIHLLLKDGVSGALGHIARDVLGLHGKFGQLAHQIEGVAKGLALIGAGSIMGKLTADVLKANAALERQVNIFKMMGNTQRDANALRSRAYDTSVMVRGSGVSENAKSGRELSSALNDNPAAMRLLPGFARVGQLLKFQTGNEGEQDMIRLAKMIELRGGANDPKTDKIDPELFKRELEASYKALAVGGGLLTTNDLQQFIKQGGSAVKGQRGNPEAFWRDYLAAVEDQGGAKAGTATTAIFRQFVGGQGLSKKYDEMERLGLMNANGWHRNKQNHIEVDDPQKAIKGYDTLLKEGVGALVEKVIRPAMESHGYKENQAQQAELYRLISTETARREIGLFLADHAQVAGVARRYDNALGSEEAGKIMNADYTHNLEALGTAFHTFATALGDAAHVAPLLGTLADGINHMAKAASMHPALARGVTDMGLLGGGALGIAGAAKIGSAVIDGFGLKGSAVALDAAAGALTVAAGRLGAAGAVGAAEDVLGAVGGKGGKVGLGGKLLKNVGKFGGLGAWGMAGAAMFTLGDYVMSGVAPENRGARYGGGRLPAPNPMPAYGPLVPPDKIMGPFRHWEEGTASGRGRAAIPGHWDMGKDAADAGKTAVTKVMDAFKSADFGAGGKAAGASTVKGFEGAGFSAAGARAASQMLGAWAGAMGGATVAPPKASPIVLHNHNVTHLDGKVVARSTMKQMVAMATMPVSISGSASDYNSHVGPGTTFQPA